MDVTMSTFIINLNDTITMSDSAVVELAKVINTCQPCVKEAQTNYNDVWIAGIICLAIVLVALIAKWAICSWKDADANVLKEERLEKVRKEKEEAKRKMLHNLIEKRIDALKDRAVTKDKDGKITGYKESTSDEFIAYDKALIEYIGKSVKEYES